MKAKKVLASAVLAGGMLMAGAASAWWGPFDWFDDHDHWYDYPPPWVLYGPYYGAPYWYGYYPYAYPYAYPYGAYTYPGYSYPTQQTPANNNQQQNSGH